MKEVALATLFLVHAAVFAYFYFARGRRTFELIFSAGFLTLATYYFYHGWMVLAGLHTQPHFIPYFRWAGLILCALATPSFLAYLVREKRRGRVEIS